MIYIKRTVYIHTKMVMCCQKQAQSCRWITLKVCAEYMYIPYSAMFYEDQSYLRSTLNQAKIAHRVSKYLGYRHFRCGLSQIVGPKKQKFWPRFTKHNDSLSPCLFVMGFWKIKLEKSSQTGFQACKDQVKLDFKPAKINFEIDFCRLHRQ